MSTERPSLIVYFRDAGLAVWGAIGMIGAIVGHAANLGFLGDIPLWFWVIALALCLAVAPARAHYKQERRNMAKWKELQDANRAMWHYNKLCATGAKIRELMNRLPKDAPHGSPVYEQFIREHLAPWVEAMQIMAKGTRWENTGLAEGIADNDPHRDYGSILNYVRGKEDWLEEVHDAYGIEDEDD